MVSNKLTSVHSVISKVLTDLDLSDNAHRVSDMIQYAGEALEFIGGLNTYGLKVAGAAGNRPLKIVNYQAKLPCDLMQLHQVAWSHSPNGPWVAMRGSTGSFDTFGNPGDGVASQGDQRLIPITAAVKFAEQLYYVPKLFETNVYDESGTVIRRVGDPITDNNGNWIMQKMSYPEAVEYLNNNPTIRHKISAVLATDTSQSNLPVTKNASVRMPKSPTGELIYSVKPGYINTNVGYGFLLVSYSGILTDDNGFPLIPDDAVFQEAVYWYIVSKLLYPKWLNGQIRDTQYMEAKAQWAIYSKRAYGNALMPNLDGMESIKNNWLRLIPEVNEHATFYSQVGDRQIIYNQNS